ncbi:MAG: type II secretion system protein GspJ [Phycisphaeraceae bacterium]
MRANKPAFTLIEVLLALSLSTLLIASVYWALAASVDAHRRAERIVEPARAMELALEQLRADLRGAVRPDGVLAVEFIAFDEPVGAGYATHALVCYTTAGTVGEAHTAGVRRVEWAVSFPTNAMASESEHPALVRRVTDNLLAPVTAEAVEQVMLPEALELSFRFYDGAEWQPDWDSVEQGDALPLAVEVTVALHQAAGRQAEQAFATDDETAYRVTRVIALPAASRDVAAEGGISR